MSVQKLPSLKFSRSFLASFLADQVIGGLFIGLSPPHPGGAFGRFWTTTYIRKIQIWADMFASRSEMADWCFWFSHRSYGRNLFAWRIKSTGSSDIISTRASISSSTSVTGEVCGNSWTCTLALGRPALGRLTESGRFCCWYWGRRKTLRLRPWCQWLTRIRIFSHIQHDSAWRYFRNIFAWTLLYMNTLQ